MSDDFLSVVGEQLAVVRRLVEQLDDDQLATQLQFERYERERKRHVASQMTATINISDGEQSPEQPPNGSQPDEAQGEQLEVARSEEPVDLGGVQMN